MLGSAAHRHAAAAPPAEVAGQLNRRFPLDEATGQFFTLLYGILNARTGELRYVSAAHPGPVYLPQGGSPTVLIGSGLPIGIADGGYREQVLTLRPGDRLYLYTDGLAEAVNDAGEQYGKRRFLEVLQEGRGADLDAGLSALWQDVCRWCGAPPRDDVSLLAVEFVGPEPSP